MSLLEEELKRLKAALAEEEGTYNQVGFSYEENENGCNGLVSQIEVEDQEQSSEYLYFIRFSSFIVL